MRRSLSLNQRYLMTVLFCIGYNFLVKYIGGFEFEVEE